MKSSNVLNNVLTVLLALCALTVTGLLLRREFSPPAQPRAAGSTIDDWTQYAREGHRSEGAGAVTIVEFSDFQCPFCRIMAHRIDSLRSEFPGQIVHVYRHYPLPSHEHAIPAARAADCAGEQGWFWPMHDAIFARQNDLGRIGWGEFAQAAGVPDLQSFQACLVSDRQLHLLRDVAAGERLGVTRTPTLLVNGLLIEGAVPIELLRDEIGRLLTLNQR